MSTGIYLPYLCPTDLSVKKPSSNSLRASLEHLTKNQLEIICESYSEKTFSKKADLIDYLYSTILSTCVKFFLYENKTLSELMLMFMKAANESNGTVEAELKFPEDKNNESEIFCYIFNCGLVKSLMRRGYIFHHEIEDDVFFSVPLEVCQEISKYIDEEGNNDFGKWENFQQLADCMLSLYGVLTARDFGKLWKIQFPETELSENQITEHLSSSAMLIGDYIWSDDLKAIHYDYHDDDDVENLIDDRKRISMYLPDREQLKNWFDDFMNSDDMYMLDYYDQYEIEHNNPYYIQMIKFFEKRRKKDWDEILHYMMYYIKDGFPMSQTINELNKDFKLTESMKKKDAEQFFLIYQNLHNSTHLWINYGWSPNELLEKNLQLQQENDQDIICFPRDLSMMDFQDIPKVGRNDPCPCGSGKKYKHCHGK